MNDQQDLKDIIAIISTKKIENKKNTKNTENTEIIKKHLVNLLAKLNNVVFLSGAGTSVKKDNSDEVINNKEKKEEINIGYPLMNDLLKSLQEDINIKPIIENAENKIKTKKLKESLEEIINNIDTLEDKNKVHAKIVEILNEIEKKDNDTSSHESLIKKINSFLPNSNRLKIFTTNYDTMFEKACEEIQYIVNDGFTFTNNIYNPLNFSFELIKNKHNDIIDYIPNLIHLYKLHGSLNWTQESEDSPIIKSTKTTAPLLIYPNKNKYEASYSLPYIDMISEFNSSLQTPNTLLIICGYSFGDKHLNNIIERAFNTNSKIHIVVIDPYKEIEDNKIEDNNYYKQANSQNNITILKCTFSHFANDYLTRKNYLMEDDNNFHNNKKTIDGSNNESNE